MLKLIIFSGLTLFTATLSANAAVLSDSVQKPVKQAIGLYQKTQQEEEHWREEKETLAAEYEELLKTQQDLIRQDEKLTLQNKTTRDRIAVKEQKVAHMKQITTRIEPFLTDLLQQIDRMVLSDSPFLMKERRRRMERLHALLKDPEIMVSEKFRKVTEALFVEAEYGQTIEVYQETISIEGQDRLVNIFRLGRLSLFFQSLDQTSCGHYSVAQKKWLPLPDIYNPQIQAAIEMGAKRRPIELLSLPIGRISKP